MYNFQLMEPDPDCERKKTSSRFEVRLFILALSLVAFIVLGGYFLAIMMLKNELQTEIRVNEDKISFLTANVSNASHAREVPDKSVLDRYMNKLTRLNLSLLNELRKHNQKYDGELRSQFNASKIQIAELEKKILSLVFNTSEVNTNQTNAIERARVDLANQFNLTRLEQMIRVTNVFKNNTSQLLSDMSKKINNLTDLWKSSVQASQTLYRLRTYSKSIYKPHYVGCTSTTFRCSDGYCVKRDWLCDGDKDCINDELDGCDPNQGDCAENRFLCSQSNSTGFKRWCIPRKFRCDGDVDCEDGSDEKDCGGTTRRPS